jgi:prevent-host-death family protein
MKKAGVRELKIHLSQYLRQVKQGENILVTERGRTIAQIVPIKSAEKRENVESVLFHLAKKGHILLPQQLGKPMGHPMRIRVKGTPFSDAVIENRR